MTGSFNKMRHPRIRAMLIKRLKELGYSQSSEFVFERNSPRESHMVTLKPSSFEVFVREHPLKEGWERRDLKYTKRNVANLR